MISSGINSVYDEAVPDIEVRLNRTVSPNVIIINKWCLSFVWEWIFEWLLFLNFSDKIVISTNNIQRANMIIAKWALW